jgi:DNA-binding winged helix-turn-helix (wHTH) protein
MSGASKSVPTRWRVSDLVIDTKRQRVWRASQEIPLSKLTYDLFAALIRRCAEVTSDEQLMEDVWPGLVVGPETVSQRVKLLRNALGDDSRMPRYIGRLRGRGYYLVPTAEALGDEAAGAPIARQPEPSPGEVVEHPQVELSLVEPASEPPSFAKPDWASTHVIPTQLFASLLETAAAEARGNLDQAKSTNSGSVSANSATRENDDDYGVERGIPRHGLAH